MILKIGLSLVVVLAVFLVFVSTKQSKFSYSVTMKMNAPVDKVFPYLSDLKLGSQWSPFEKADPNMKKEYVGNKLIFSGNKDAGSGTLEILNTVPNQSVDLKLIMTAPIAVANDVKYEIIPVEGGSQVTWSMSGENGFFIKILSTFMNMEKMMQEQFTAGLNNLKAIVE